MQSTLQVWLNLSLCFNVKRKIVLFVVRKMNNDIQIINLAVNDSDKIPNPVRTFYEAFHNDGNLFSLIF